MSQSRILSASVLAAMLGLSGCGGDDSTSAPVENPTTVNEQSTISGTIVDASGTPLANTTVKMGDTLFTTDNTGSYRFELPTLDAATKTVVFVKKSGYLSTARELVLLPEQSYQLDVTLSPDQVSTAFSSSAGITDLLVSGATVSIPANGVSYADGTPFTGTVNIAANYYNPDSVEGAQSFAQPFMGQNADGSDETGLVTVGVIDVKLTDPATGNELNLASGTRATLTYPAASTDQDLDSIPLWYYDEDKMIWVKDGSATRQADGSYRGEVSHFTLWNLDIPLNQAKALVKGCIVDAGTKVPFTDAFVAEVYGRGHFNSGYADRQGKFSFYVPVNTPLTLSPMLDSIDFDDVAIPALASDVTYNINDGVCIDVRSINVDVEEKEKRPFNYTQAFEDSLGTLPAPPVEFTPPTLPDPINPPMGNNPGLRNIIGYDFSLEVSYDVDNQNSNDSMRIDDILMTTIYNADMGTSFIEKSLYGYGYDIYDTTTELLNRYDEGLILTPQGISDSLDFILFDQDTIIATFLNSHLINNQWTQSLSNGFTSTSFMSDTPLTGQRIGDVLARINNDPDDTYNNIPTGFVQKLNALPTDLSVFKNGASCKVEVSGSVNTNSILINGEINASRYEQDYIDSPLKGTWAGIPWGRYPTEDYSWNTYVKYNNGLYAGNYRDTGFENVSLAEQDDCVLYNEAAKAQILAAIEAAYPEL